MNNIWSFHDEKVKELKQLYDRMSKQTQNDLQKAFDTFNFSFDNLYDVADTKTKKKADTIIEEYQDKGLLKGYFGILAKNIYIRKNVKNNEILELLIYGAYIEEQSKLEEKENQVFKEDVNHYYQEGQEEVNKTLKKKKPISVIDEALFLYLLEQPNFTGFNWKQYIDSTIKFNAEQIYKQAVIKLQQRKELDINDNEFKRLFDLQNKQKININQDKISGAVDEELIGLNNQAKVEGIKKLDNDAQIRFLAVTDENSTDMCQSMKDKLFYVDKENDFYRMYGETQNTLRNEHIKVQGLVLGINLPPITHHFHWCRSTIMYSTTPIVEKEEKTEYNLDIPRVSKEVKQLLNNTKLNYNVKRLFNKYLTSDNVEIKNDLEVPMRYSINDNKIYINPAHTDFKYYDLSESLSHEIIHMIDIRNNISKKLNIDNELRRTRLQIDIDEDRYIKMLTNNKYEDNMTLGDIFASITNGRITGNYGHDIKYWLEDSTRVEKELSANIMSAYLTNNKDTLDIINSILGLKEIKEKVVRIYNDYTK